MYVWSGLVNKIIFYLRMKYMELKLEGGIKTGRKYVPCVPNSGNQSISLYWVIKFYSRGGIMFECPDLASGMRIYSLKKSCFKSSPNYF